MIIKEIFNARNRPIYNPSMCCRRYQ